MWDHILGDPKTDYHVEVSYFEIYSEQIYDLLIPRGRDSKLKVCPPARALWNGCGYLQAPL